jgi:NADP-dependent 3-hydroxy acid dehydrogenase YdfG
MAGKKTAPIAVVTGASSGIGAATARALASRGYHVIAGARRIERVRQVVADPRDAIHLDVTDKRSVEEFADAIQKRYRHIDVLVNNAGGALGLAPVADASDADWITMWQTNVLGLMYVTRACLPLLRKARHGHIVPRRRGLSYRFWQRRFAGQPSHAAPGAQWRADQGHRGGAWTGRD